MGSGAGWTDRSCTASQARWPTGPTAGGLPDWRAAHCRDGRGALVELFFSDEPGLIDRAKAICTGCPVAAPCLQMAVDRQEPWGVWGGQLFVGGRAVAVKRGRGRPRKEPALAAG